MDLNKRIESYLQESSPLLNNALLHELVDMKWADLIENSNIKSPDNYSTANVLLNENLPLAELEEMSKGIFIEIPDFMHLSSFYKEHGLQPISKHECDVINAIKQLRNAFDFLCYENACRENIESLVKCIQVLRQPEPEFDISYSHPQVPFTIFVSIGHERSKNDTIRLAESILHETMHLKLTIIEQFCPMVNDNNYHFFSPWRDEERPVQGVLHGMYVFKTILDFYESVLPLVEDIEQYDFIDWRIESIKSEFKALKSFPSNMGLSANGAILARNLLPSN